MMGERRCMGETAGGSVALFVLVDAGASAVDV